MTADSKREQYWDIVKGLGILCIVLAHCCPKGSVIAFVYLFHVPLFFFISGFLFDENKWGEKGIAGYIGSRFMKVWPRFLGYSVFFALIHNLFVHLGLMSGGYFDKTTVLARIVEGAMFGSVDNNAGAMWFIMPWLLSSIAFGTVLLLARKYLSAKARVPVCALILAGMTAAGFFFFKKDLGLSNRAEVALLMTGTMAFGWLLRKYIPGIRKYLGFISLILSFGILLLFRTVFGVRLELSGRLAYFPAVLVHIPAGIIMTMSLAELLCKVPKVRDLSAFLGKHSFDIMALHFMVFKLIDLVYIKFYPEMEEYSAGFPVSFPKALFPLYLILGLLLPAFAGAGIDRLSGKILSKLKKAAEK